MVLTVKKGKAAGAQGASAAPSQEPGTPRLGVLGAWNIETATELLSCCGEYTWNSVAGRRHLALEGWGHLGNGVTGCGIWAEHKG